VRGIVASRPYQLSSIRREGNNDPASFAWGIERSLTAEQLARSIQVALKQSFVNDHALVAELRDRMPEVMPETIVTDVGDAMFLTNNPAMQAIVDDSVASGGVSSRLAQVAELDQAVIELFIATLGREPQDTEKQAVLSFVKNRVGQTGDTKSLDAWKNAVWAVITSAEFRFNH
jgi:hypothetical protein